LKNIDPLKAREDIENILSQKEYQAYYREEKNTLADLLQRLQDWLNRYLGKWLPEPEIRESTSEWISYGMVGLGIAMVLLLLFLFSSKVVRENRFYSKPIGTESEFILTPQSHLEEADKRLEEGDLRSAQRHLFLAYLLSLDQHQWIEAKAWKTNGEYFDELQGKQLDIATMFHTLASRFEATWYGGRPLTKEDYVEYHQQVVNFVTNKDGHIKGEQV
jgi:hypothetical protein